MCGTSWRGVYTGLFLSVSQGNLPLSPRPSGYTAALGLVLEDSVDLG